MEIKTLFYWLFDFQQDLQYSGLIRFIEVQFIPMNVYNNDSKDRDRHCNEHNLKER